MAENRVREADAVGLKQLPRRWATAVQVVGTFGLAVFLVLYYVLVVQPREAARYDQLRASVGAMLQVVEANQSLLTRQQAANLETLYVEAVANEAADRIVKALEQGQGSQNLQSDLVNILVVRAALLQGFVRKDGAVVSELLVNKLRYGKAPESLAAAGAAGNWKATERAQILYGCREAILFDLAGLAK